MIRFLLASLLIAHGLIHVAIYAIPKQPGENALFDPGHSWILAGMNVAARPARTTAVTLAWVTAVVAALSGLVLKLGYFHPWLIIGLALDAGVIAGVVSEWPPSLF